MNVRKVRIREASRRTRYTARWLLWLAQGELWLHVSSENLKFSSQAARDLSGVIRANRFARFARIGWFAITEKERGRLKLSSEIDNFKRDFVFVEIRALTTVAILISEQENPLEKIHPNLKMFSWTRFFCSEQYPLGSRLMSQGRRPSSREFLEKARVNAVSFWYFRILGGFLVLCPEGPNL